MTAETILYIINQYFTGIITRNELMLKAKEIKPDALCYEDYCSYDFLVFNDIIKVLAEIPELSYNDAQLMEICGILENKRNIRSTYLFKIPKKILGKNDLRLIEIVESFTSNYKSGKIIVDFDADSLASYIDKDKLEFLSQFNNELSSGENNTIIKTIEMDIFALLNRFGGLWESIKSCFMSGNDVSVDFLFDRIKGQLEILCGIQPVFICLSGKLNRLNVSLF